MAHWSERDREKREVAFALPQTVQVGGKLTLLDCSGVRWRVVKAERNRTTRKLTTKVPKTAANPCRLFIREGDKLLRIYEPGAFGDRCPFPSFDWSAEALQWQLGKARPVHESDYAPPAPTRRP